MSASDRFPAEQRSLHKAESLRIYSVVNHCCPRVHSGSPYSNHDEDSRQTAEDRLTGISTDTRVSTLRIGDSMLREGENPSRCLGTNHN
jgi:hypothetical protein